MNFALFFAFLIGVLATSCNPSEEEIPLQQQSTGEYIYRLHHEFFFVPSPPERQSLPKYPWDDKQGFLPKITKEYFHCKGNRLNPPKVTQTGNDYQVYSDCNGREGHSLPLRNNKEFIYPILIDLANYIQEKTGKKVLITAGHRCPTHHLYVDHSSANASSKHMIGAEMAFYVEGLESQPNQIVDLVFAFYRENPRYRENKEFVEFKRYQKSDSGASIQPWYNKEVFVKIYQKNEGRDFDNQHSFPYIKVQVRHDRDIDAKVVYSWKEANRNYLRK